MAPVKTHQGSALNCYNRLMSSPQLDHSALLVALRELHRLMRDGLHAHLQTATLETMSRATRFEGGDTIYELDTRGEKILLAFCERWGKTAPFLLVCEGLPDGRQLFGTNDLEAAHFILICDPIDGTRPLMYDKRSAWLLTGIAPNLGEKTNLSDIEVAVQSELPTSKAGWADVMWARRGHGAHGVSQCLFERAERALRLRPSSATTIEGGYAMFSKFFPGSKGWLANLEEQLISQVLGEPKDGQPATFDDQYISTGGQIFELMTGRDRFHAELRPLAHQKLHGAAHSRLCSHPYDICTELIAREAGAIITDLEGENLQFPLDVETPVSWIGYANAAIRSQIEPVLLPMLRAL